VVGRHFNFSQVVATDFHAASQELGNEFTDALQHADDALSARCLPRPHTIEDWERLARIVEIPPADIGMLTAREIHETALAWADRQSIKAQLAARARITTSDRSYGNLDMPDSPRPREGNFTHAGKIPSLSAESKFAGGIQSSLQTMWSCAASRFATVLEAHEYVRQLSVSAKRMATAALSTLAASSLRKRLDVPRGPAQSLA
jgi:hypothetical protein